MNDIELVGGKEVKTKMSKFDYASFFGGYDEFAVSKEKYTKEQAIEIAKVEMESHNKPYFIAVGEGFVRHRAGRNEDNEPCVGWWLEYKQFDRSRPCWIFHKVRDTGAFPESQFGRQYEYIEILET